MRRLLMAAGGGGSFAAPAPSPYSDEFDDSATETVWGETAGLAPYGTFDIDTTYPGAIHMDHAIVYRVAPSIPFTVEHKCVAVDWDTGPDIGGVWITFAEAAPGPMWGGGVDVGFVGTMWLSGSSFNSSGAFTGNQPANGLDAVAGYGYAVPHHSRMTVTAGPTVKQEISFDEGGTWTVVNAAYSLGFDLNYIGIWATGCTADIDWFRTTLS